MNILMRTYLPAVVLAIITLTVNAGPGHHPGVKGKFMSFFDSNEDKIVTLDELNKGSVKRFAKMDADGNNIVSAEEFKTYINQRRQEHRQARFQMMDRNSDGAVSEQEFINHTLEKTKRRFMGMDANNDGVIGNDEFIHHKRYRHGGKRKHHRGHRLFSKLDANDDGQVTREESITAWSNWFKRIDANNNQIVTADEVKKYRDQPRRQ